MDGVGERWVSDSNCIFLTGDRAIVVFDVTCCGLECNWSAGCENGIFLHPVFIIYHVIKDAVADSRNQRLFVAEGDEFW